MDTLFTWLMFYGVIAVIVAASYFISAKVYAVLLKNGNGSAKTIRAVAFVASFLIIFFIIAYIFLMSFRFER